MSDQQKRARLREILTGSEGAVAPGVTDPLFARLAADCGYSVVHLSGNAIHKNFCLVDQNILTASEIAQRAAQINEALDIPLIVDAGPAPRTTNVIARAVRAFERAGAAAIRFEDSSIEERGGDTEAISIASKAVMVDRIKAAVDVRTDSTLVLIARCDARVSEPLAQIHDRLAAYVEAGADAIGVQLNNPEEFRQIGARSPAPLVSLWPKTSMTVFEFLQLGFRIALMPSSVPLAGLSAAREMLLELNEKGTDRDYFSRQKEFQEIERWYRNLGRQ